MDSTPGAPILGDLSYGERLFFASLRHPWTKPLAARAVRKATRLLALAFGESLRTLREAPDPLMRAHASAREHAGLVTLLWEILDLVGSRVDKLPEHRRPHYSPPQRWRILVLKQLLAFSADETARLFRVSTGTILGWEAEAGREPDQKTIGSLLKPIPPLRRYADVVRHTTGTLALVGIGGTAKIAETLARAGWKLARETVRRFLHQPPPVTTTPRTKTARARTVEPLRAHRPHHIWIVDLTQVKGLFGRVRFRVAAVFDAFSRMPLALAVFGHEPTATEVARLVQRAVRRHGTPGFLVSDHGGHFTATQFARGLRGIPHRFGAVGAKGSIALLERWWRTLKETLRLPLLRPSTSSDIEERLAYAVLHYAFFRPHQGLGGQTPAEVLYGWPPEHLRAERPPRGAPGSPAPPPPFTIDFLDPLLVFRTIDQP